MPFKSSVTDKAMWKHVRKCKFEEVLCQNCGKVFMSKYKHSIHQKDCLEKSQKPLECPLCSKLFSTSRLLERHTRLAWPQWQSFDNKDQLAVDFCSKISSRNIHICFLYHFQMGLQKRPKSAFSHFFFRNQNYQFSNFRQGGL